MESYGSPQLRDVQRRTCSRIIIYLQRIRDCLTKLLSADPGFDILALLAATPVLSRKSFTTSISAHQRHSLQSQPALLLCFRLQSWRKYGAQRATTWETRAHSVTLDGTMAPQTTPARLISSESRRTRLRISWTRCPTRSNRKFFELWGELVAQNRSSCELSAQQ